MYQSMGHYNPQPDGMNDYKKNGTFRSRALDYETFD